MKNTRRNSVTTNLTSRRKALRRRSSPCRSCIHINSPSKLHPYQPEFYSIIHTTYTGTDDYRTCFKPDQERLRKISKLSFVFLDTAGSDITAALPGVNQSFPGDVEAEANSYFQKIYNQPPNPTMTIDEVLEMLKKFKDSSSKKEKVNFVFCVPSLIYSPHFIPKTLMSGV